MVFDSSEEENRSGILAKSLNRTRQQRSRTLSREPPLVDKVNLPSREEPHVSEDDTDESARGTYVATNLSNKWTLEPNGILAKALQEAHQQERAANGGSHIAQANGVRHHAPAAANGNHAASSSAAQGHAEHRLPTPDFRRTPIGHGNDPESSTFDRRKNLFRAK